MRARWVVLAIAASLAACGGDDGGGSSDRVDGVPVPWLVVKADGSEETLRIGYESDPCTRARLAAVEFDEEAVTVTLSDPERDPRKACVALADPGCVTVRLSEPLAGRRVVDGAPDAFPQRKRGTRNLPFSRYGACRPVPVSD